MSRSSRILAGLLMAAALVAGCQCAAPPPKLSAPVMKPFVGGWGAHASDMTIRGDGFVQLEVQVSSLTLGDGSEFRDGTCK